jgi:hypothetical protein
MFMACACLCSLREIGRPIFNHFQAEFYLKSLKPRLATDPAIIMPAKKTGCKRFEAARFSSQ